MITNNNNINSPELGSDYNMNGIQLTGYSKRAGWNTNKILHMYTSLIERGMPSQVAFDLVRQAYIETPNNLYAFGKKYGNNYNDWADHMMKSATKRNLLNVKNYQDFKTKNKSFNPNPQYWNNLQKGREADKEVFNKFNKQNGIDQVISYNPTTVNNDLQLFNDLGNQWIDTNNYT